MQLFCATKIETEREKGRSDLTLFFYALKVPPLTRTDRLTAAAVSMQARIMRNNCRIKGLIRNANDPLRLRELLGIA